MPYLKTYDIFISHAWKYGDHYKNLIRLLYEAPNFSFRNYSAPEDNPLKTPDGIFVSNKKQIQDAIERKIKPVNAVLVISGMYYPHREWMQFEIDTALNYNKPIIALKPHHYQRMPSIIQEVATDIVSWNTASIVSSIRTHSI